KSTPPPSSHQSLIAQPSSSPPQQPSQPEEISRSVMALLNHSLETCATLTKKVGGCIQTGGKIAELDADEDVTLEEVDAKKDAEVQGRLPESQAQVYHLDLEHT
nr:hypothetical protein [Tanacetum cinerariifolium]